MALDPRSFPGLASDLRSLKSSASTPSLRSRDSTDMPPTRPMTPNGSASAGAGAAGVGNVRVVVRVRAFLPRETNRGAQCLIDMNPSNQSTTLLAPSTSDAVNGRNSTRKVVEPKTFTFDNSFWSHDKADDHYATQEDVYNCLGEEFLDHNFEGYHTCIFAYGQTGSGKSYTMMGAPEQPGLIPRTCEDLFQRIESNTSPNVSYTVRVSYFEVYNEHVRDLLVPRQDPPYYLKIRESPTEGPYVKDLTDVPVKSFAELMRYMRMGDTSRTTASTKMNDTSSRSHAVFTIMLKQIHHDMDTDETTERMARIRLVDLAGSERAKSTEATGQRLREGSNINKSLTTLGRVIAALASDPRQHSGGRKARRATKDIVPYRDSILTWLLKDSLGGNSKTAMIACISPCDYDETLSTLRYADQAKRIRTRAIVNQDHVSAAERDAQIVDMQETIRRLQLSVSQQAQQQQQVVLSTAARLRDNENQASQQLEEYQKQVDLMQQMMQEEKQVSECKIRTLQTQNEALRRHLRLAVESLKNPIPDVPSLDDDDYYSVDDGEQYDDSGGGHRGEDGSGSSDALEQQLVHVDSNSGARHFSPPPPPPPPPHGSALVPAEHDRSPPQETSKENTIPAKPRRPRYPSLSPFSSQNSSNGSKGSNGSRIPSHKTNATNNNNKRTSTHTRGPLRQSSINPNIPLKPTRSPPPALRQSGAAAAAGGRYPSMAASLTTVGASSAATTTTTTTAGAEAEAAAAAAALKSTEGAGLETHAELRDLLSDIGFFRRKLADDHVRFGGFAMGV